MAATGIFTLVSVPFLLVVPLLVAVLLNQRIRAGAFFRGIFFAPYVLGVAVIGVIWKYLLDTQSGIVNHVLGQPSGDAGQDPRRRLRRPPVLGLLRRGQRAFVLLEGRGECRG